MKSFPDDLVVYLAQHVDCRATLAALCRVSKSLRDIFRSELYKRIWLDRCSFSSIESIASLPMDSHLKYTERCHIGPWIQIDSGNSYDEVAGALGSMLQKMVNLRSLTLMGKLLRDFADDPSRDSDEDNTSESEERRLGSPLECLFRLEHIEEISLVSTFDDIMDFKWAIPRFQSLRKLAIHRLERESSGSNVDDIAEVLIASPGLKSLGLSLMPEPGLVNDMLRTLINYYHLKSKGCRLRLSEIHLGLGFLPVGPGWSFPQDDYLDQLTDLSALVNLRLDNWSSNPEHYDVANFEIHARLFFHATRIEKISVERLSPDIVELIELLRETAARPGALSDIEVSRYFETLEPQDEEFWDEIMQGKNLCSIPLEQTGFRWQRVSYGAKLKNDKHNMSEHLLQSFAAQCAGLREISMPLGQEHLDLFKASIMPRLGNLRTLIIPRGYIADLILPEPGSYIRDQMSKRRKIEYAESNRKLDAEHELQRLNLAKELFQHNRFLIRPGSDISPLRYIGLGSHVYCCLLANSFSTPPMVFSPQGTAGDSEFQIIKLSPEQARDFDAVRRLDLEYYTFY